MFLRSVLKFTVGKGGSIIVLSPLVLLLYESEIILPTPLLFEYEDVLKRNQLLLNLDSAEIEIILDNLCSLAQFQKVYFLWRPYLPDPKDDMVLELAVVANIKTIVTHNLKDFAGINRFGVEAKPPPLKNFWNV